MKDPILSLIILRHNSLEEGNYKPFVGTPHMIRYLKVECKNFGRANRHQTDVWWSIFFVFRTIYIFLNVIVKSLIPSVLQPWHVRSWVMEIWYADTAGSSNILKPYGHGFDRSSSSFIRPSLISVNYLVELMLKSVVIKLINCHQNFSRRPQ